MSSGLCTVEAKAIRDAGGNPTHIHTSPIGLATVGMIIPILYIKIQDPPHTSHTHYHYDVHAQIQSNPQRRSDLLPSTHPDPRLYYPSASETPAPSAHLAPTPGFPGLKHLVPSGRPIIISPYSVVLRHQPTSVNIITARLEQKILHQKKPHAAATFPPQRTARTQPDRIWFFAHPSPIYNSPANLGIWPTPPPDLSSENNKAAPRQPFPPRLASPLPKPPPAHPPRHGSSTSSTAGFPKAQKTSVVVVSSGYGVSEEWTVQLVEDND